MAKEQLHAAIYPESEIAKSSAQRPEWAAIHEELAKHKNLNLQFMWEEYRGQYPDGFGYSRFCDLYREWRKSGGREVSLYHERRAAEIMEVDSTPRTQVFAGTPAGWATRCRAWSMAFPRE
jgi:transposase